MPDKFELLVPLDASGVDDFQPGQAVKVLAQGRERLVRVQVVEIDREAKGVATFGFEDHPGPLRVLLGPPEATDKELLSMETMSVPVPVQLWRRQRRLELKPIKIAPYYWYWWKRWCRTYTIRGRVVCPDGRPVPGATVCAHDVDHWFWWSSTQLVGCDTTDENGAFEIKFRWCCVFLPWWWWRRRVWKIDPWLIRRIKPVLERRFPLKLGRMGNQPSLAPFAHLIPGEGPIISRRLDATDAQALERIRERLVRRLPRAPELEELKIWPWSPWWPWRDCVPDIIFKVTQDTEVPNTVIVDEETGDTRWNISNPLNVTLVASEEAWCRPECEDPPCEGAECLLITNICYNSIDQVGGNMGAAPAPVGYLNPDPGAAGTITWGIDRPYAGVVNVHKSYHDVIDVDYYEIEYKEYPGGSWGPLPGGAARDFRRYWMKIEPNLTPPPLLHIDTGSVAFVWQDIDGHEVVESREYFEAHGGLGGWDVIRWWTRHRDLVVPLDSSKFPDDTYAFRVVGWQKDASGNLTNRRVLHICNTTEDNYFYLTFDNRLLPDPAHPTSATHPCGEGTVHLCTTEPDTDFTSVRIGGTLVHPCDVVNRDAHAMLEVEFMAHDPAGHLAKFELLNTYGENLAVNLLSCPGATLTGLTAADVPGWVAGHEQGSYGMALSQGATSPYWYGGNYRLTVPVDEAFPEPCCYQLELRAWKRNVLHCDHDFHYQNFSHYTIGVGVCPPVP